MNFSIQNDETQVFDIKPKYRKNNELYITFSTQCDEKRFVMFNDIIGFNQLVYKYKSGCDNINCNIRWRSKGHYNRCCSLRVLEN